jgi:hypothetical protein
MRLENGGQSTCLVRAGVGTGEWASSAWHWAWITDSEEKKKEGKKNGVNCEE